MIEKAVIYNTIDRTGMAPEDVYNQKTLPMGVSIRVDLTRSELKDLFWKRDIDKLDNTDRFGQKLLEYMHKEMLVGVKNDKKIELKNAHRPYGNTDFIR